MKARSKTNTGRVAAAVCAIVAAGCDSLPVIEVDGVLSKQLRPARIGPDPLGDVRARMIFCAREPAPLRVVALAEALHSSSIPSGDDRYAVNNVGIGARATFGRCAE